MAATFDNFSVGNHNSGASTLSWNHVLGNLGSTGLIIVCAAGETIAGGSSNQDITGITFNGVSMTLVGSDKNTSSHSTSVAMYELHGASVPAAGTYSIVVSFTNASNSAQSAGAMSFYGVKSQIKEAEGSTNANGTNPLAKSITTVTTNALLVTAYGSQNTPNATSTTSDTRAFNSVPSTNEQNECDGFYRTVAVAGSANVSLTVSNPETEAMIAASFETVPSGSALFYSYI